MEFFDSHTDWVYHLILPGPRCRSCSSGSTPPAALSVLDTLHGRAHGAPGVSERQVLLEHVLRNSMIPIVPCGARLRAVWPAGRSSRERVRPQGVGQYAFESVRQLDVPPVLTITMFGACLIVVLNTVVDILYAAFDPRIRLQ